MRVDPYLFFAGNCEQALEFYREALGAELEMLMRYKEAPEAPPPGMVSPGWDDKVLHASLRIGATRVMASDDYARQSKPGGFALSIAAANVAEGERLFARLADGGKVTMPFGKTFWSAGFGMLTDRFGVGWMVNTETRGDAV